MQEANDGVPTSYYGKAPPPYYEEAPPPITARPGDLAVLSYERGEPTPARVQLAEPSGYAQPSGRPAVIEEDKSFQKETVCVGGILVASCFELADGAPDYCEGNSYAKATGAISIFVCLFYFAICRPVEVFNKYLSIFLMLWWGVGTATLTSTVTFICTWNGYFACWGATLLSLCYFQITVSRFKLLGERITEVVVGDRKRKVLMFIMVFSFYEAAAFVIFWKDIDYYIPKRIRRESWALFTGFISGIFVVLYFLKGIRDRGSSGQSGSLKYFSWFLALWWLIAVGVTTYGDPFFFGNGYICSWGAFVCSFYLVYLTTVITRESSV